MGDLTKDFSRDEFRCHCCGGLKFEVFVKQLAKALQELRDLIEAEIGEHPILINCGYRCVKHNGEVGGSLQSRHKISMAADVRCPGLEPVELAGFAQRIEAFDRSGIGIYEDFVHLDVGRKVRWRKSE